MIIQVNGELCVSGVTNSRIAIEFLDGTKDEIAVHYVPGNLIVTVNQLEKIQADSVSRISFLFEKPYEKGKFIEYSFFEIEMKKYHFKKDYLILHIYDFKDRRYRRKYGCLTEDEFIYEFEFRGSGTLISCK
ncbi:hypothetical protein POW22_10345 [Gilvibacter sediminis]|nr:hypothetical protein [Gilvibacter sediminis]